MRTLIPSQFHERNKVVLQEKSIDKLLESIKASKQKPFAKVLFGLGIRHVGERVAQVIVKSFKTIDNLLKQNIDDIENVSDIGPEIAKSIVDYFSDTRNIELVKRLKENGLNLYFERNEKKSSKLDEMRIVITGVFSQFSRADLKKIVEEHGGKNVSSISKNTTFVLAGENMGPSKKIKAEKLGIIIISEEEFINKIK